MASNGRKHGKNATSRARTKQAKEPAAGAVPVAFEPDQEMEAHFGLKGNQIRAIHVYVTTGNVTQAAEAAGVHRGTVHRWLQKDHHFMAAVNQYRRILRQSYQDQLLQAGGRALETLLEAIEQGEDPELAFKFLKGLGLLSGRLPELDPTNPAFYESREVLEEMKFGYGMDLEERRY